MARIKQWYPRPQLSQGNEEKKKENCHQSPALSLISIVTLNKSLYLSGPLSPEWKNENTRPEGSQVFCSLISFCL